MSKARGLLRKYFYVSYIFVCTEPNVCCHYSGDSIAEKLSFVFSAEVSVCQEDMMGGNRGHGLLKTGNRKYRRTVKYISQLGWGHCGNIMRVACS